MPRLLLLGIVALALWSHLWGIRGDLPWAYESDEGKFAVLAIRMAMLGDPNPHWFGHPGSTFVYPLAATFQVANAYDAGLPVLQLDPGLGARVGGDPGRYFVLGRLLAVLYAIAALPLVYLIGRRVFDATTGVVAAWLALLSPLALAHAQMIRTDSAGVFFGLLALWLVLRVLDRPGRGAHALAGLAIGAAIGTRYFLVTLAPVLLCADLVLLVRTRPGSDARRAVWIASVTGMACIALGFALTTPYFVLDFPTVWQNLGHEMREQHLGADGLGFEESLVWYLTTALPNVVPRVWLALAALGLALAALRRNVAALLIALAVATFVIAISTASLHWERWLVQVLPLVAILAAAALTELGHGVVRMRRGSARSAAIAVAVATVLVSAQPALAYLRFASAQAEPSTRIVAREWIVANVPAGSTIAADFYTAPLHDTELRADYHFALAADGDLEHYRRAGYDYVMVSDAIFARYQRERRRYPREAAFYDELFRNERLVKRFTLRDAVRGPTISLFALKDGR